MRLKYISWLPMIVFMIVIFSFSAKPAEQSDESSLTIANGILNAYEKVIGNTTQVNSRLELLKKINHFVRKGAHVTEYAVLGIAVVFFLYTWNVRRWNLAFLSIMITVVYAITDEFHQLYVPGRSGELKDVGIDTIGAVFGALLFIVFLWYYNKRSQKNNTVNASK